MEILQVRRFRRSRRFPKLEDSEERGDSPGVRIQKNVEIPQLQYIVKMVDDTADDIQKDEKLVEVTVIMRTNSGSPSTTANSGDASDSGSGNSSER